MVFAVESDAPWTLHFHVSGWSLRDADRGIYREKKVPGGRSILRFAFDISPHFVPSGIKPVFGDVAKDATIVRWAKGDSLNLDLFAWALRRPAEHLERGPLIPAKAKALGTPDEAIFALPATVAVEPIPDNAAIRGA